MDLGISGRSALVCASTSGLGRAIARQLADEGVRVVINGRTEERVADACDEIRERGGDAVGIALDLTADGATAELVERAQAAIGDIDILVLNSGGPAPGTATDVDQDGVTAAIDSLVRPHVSLVNAVVPGMRERNWGRILAVGSSGIEAPIPTLALSNLGRGALANYLKSLATEVAADGVTVNLVLPGRIDTERVQSLDQSAADKQGITAEEAKSKTLATIPAGRYGEPEEFGAAGAFLCSAHAAYITGTALRVDGGSVPTL